MTKAVHTTLGVLFYGAKDYAPLDLLRSLSEEDSRRNLYGKLPVVVLSKEQYDELIAKPSLRDMLSELQVATLRKAAKDAQRRADAYVGYGESIRYQKQADTIRAMLGEDEHSS